MAIFATSRRSRRRQSAPTRSADSSTRCVLPASPSPSPASTTATRSARISRLSVVFLGVAAALAFCSLFPTPTGAYILIPGRSLTMPMSARLHRSRQYQRQALPSPCLPLDVQSTQVLRAKEDDSRTENVNMKQDDEGSGRLMEPPSAAGVNSIEDPSAESGSNPKLLAMKQERSKGLSHNFGNANNSPDSMVTSQYEPGSFPAFSRSNSGSVIDVQPPTLQRRTMYDPSRLGPAGRAFMAGCGSPEECDLRFSNYLGVLLNMMNNGKRK